MATNAASPTADETDTADAPDTVGTLDRTLDQWRERIDQLKVQLDLATLDIREDLTKRLEVTENIYLAVRSRLSDARKDTGKSAGTLQQSVHQLMIDLRRAYDDAEAVVKRSHQP